VLVTAIKIFYTASYVHLCIFCLPSLTLFFFLVYCPLTYVTQICLSSFIVSFHLSLVLLELHLEMPTLHCAAPWKSLVNRSLSCTKTCLHYRGLCCIGRVYALGLSCTWMYTVTLYHYNGVLCASWTCLQQRGPSCTWTCPDNRSLASSGRVYITGAWAALEHTLTAEACISSGFVYTTEACAPHQHVFTLWPNFIWTCLVFTIQGPVLGHVYTL